MPEQFIIVARLKGALRCETKYYGPFTDFDKAETFLCCLGGGIWDEKFIQELCVPASPVIDVVPTLIEVRHG